jgi:hypothetical protein
VSHHASVSDLVVQGRCILGPSMLRDSLASGSDVNVLAIVGPDNLPKGDKAKWHAEQPLLSIGTTIATC